MKDELNRLNERHRQAAVESVKKTDGVEASPPQEGSLWRRKSTGETYTIRSVDEWKPGEYGVFAKELCLDGFWRGPLESFLEQFEPCADEAMANVGEGRHGN